MNKTIKAFVLTVVSALTTSVCAKDGQIVPDTSNSGTITNVRGGQIVPDTSSKGDSITTSRGGTINSNVGKNVQKTNTDYQQGIACQKAQDEIANRYTNKLSSITGIQDASLANRNMFMELEKLIDQGTCPESMRADVRRVINESETARRGVYGGTDQ